MEPTWQLLAVAGPSLQAGEGMGYELALIQ